MKTTFFVKCIFHKSGLAYPQKSILKPQVQMWDISQRHISQWVYFIKYFWLFYKLFLYLSQFTDEFFLGTFECMVAPCIIVICGSHFSRSFVWYIFCSNIVCLFCQSKAEEISYVSYILYSRNSIVKLDNVLLIL